jgi:hypothetical protein
MIKFFCLILTLIFILFFYSLQKTSEGFLSGTDIQLLTSKPYYTQYDYLTQARKYPYDYKYPSYGYPSYDYSRYGYPSYDYSRYGYPSYDYSRYGYPTYDYPTYDYPINRNMRHIFPRYGYSYNYYKPILL